MRAIIWVLDVSIAANDNRSLSRLLESRGNEVILGGVRGRSIPLED